MQSVAELCLEIEAAWSDATYPGDREVFAGYENEEWIARELVGKQWRDVDHDFARLFASGDNLQITRPRAIAYYVPVFLLSDIEYACMPLINILAPSPPEDRDEWHIERFESRIKLFTEAQLRAIAMYFAFDRKRRNLLDDDWNLVVEFYGKYLGPLVEELAVIDWS